MCGCSRAALARREAGIFNRLHERCHHAWLREVVPDDLLHQEITILDHPRRLVHVVCLLVTPVLGVIKTFNIMQDVLPLLPKVGVRAQLLESHQVALHLRPRLQSHHFSSLWLCHVLDEAFALDLSLPDIAISSVEDVLYFVFKHLLLLEELLISGLLVVPIIVSFRLVVDLGE